MLKSIIQLYSRVSQRTETSITAACVCFPETCVARPCIAAPFGAGAFWSLAKAAVRSYSAEETSRTALEWRAVSVQEAFSRGLPPGRGAQALATSTGEDLGHPCVWRCRCNSENPAIHSRFCCATWNSSFLLSSVHKAALKTELDDSQSVWRRLVWVCSGFECVVHEA